MSRNLPPIVDVTAGARVGEMPIRPPFRFTGVSSRVMPLKADMARLAAFCDRYVNMDVPPEIVQFRPALPYVYLMVLDYGRMGSATTHAQNVGFVAQHEVAFTVPLERWQRVGGQWQFRGWACVSPFIFVDDEMSLTTGREVYGWPKVAGVVEQTQPLWDQHPLAGTRLLTFSTHVTEHVYAGQAEAPRVLLQIDADPGPAYSRVPPDPSSPWMPWSAVSQAARSTLAVAGSALDIALGLRARGWRTDRHPRTLLAMGREGLRMLQDGGPSLLAGLRRAAADPVAGGTPAGLGFDNITLKQFRDAAEPHRACYQALVRSAMRIERLNGSGLLGESALWRGDVSGGLTVRLHRHGSQPIIESLGLEVAATEGGQDGGVAVSVLKPVFPFWTEVDLLYGVGQVLCERGSAQAPRPHWVPGPAVAAPDHVPSAGEDPLAPFNTALGAATQPVAGPFHVPDLTLQVYPLPADPPALARLVRQTLSEPLADSGWRFEPVGTHALLVVQVTGDELGTMWSATENLGWWAEREVAFAVPVRCLQRSTAGTWEALGTALLMPFVYGSEGRAVITDREVTGRPTLKATIESPPDVWLAPGGPARERRLVRVATEVFPALGVGERAVERPLLEIDHLPDEDSTAEAAPALPEALGLLDGRIPLHTLVLKQYRDAAEVDHGCYQALVLTQRFLQPVTDERVPAAKRGVQPLAGSTVVRVHRHVGHPIVEALGLAQGEAASSRDGEVVHTLRAERPFWLRASARDELATVLAERQGGGGWRPRQDWPFGEPAQQ